MVGLALFLLFVLVPAAELYVIFRVADGIGWLDTLAILVIVSLAGAWLVRRAGLRALVRTQAELAQGKVPTAPIVEGLIVLVAGALMLTPGFLTDIAGLLLLFPPVRAGMRKLLIRRYSGRVRRTGHGDVIDAESFEVTDREIDP